MLFVNVGDDVAEVVDPLPDARDKWDGHQRLGSVRAGQVQLLGLRQAVAVATSTADRDRAFEPVRDQETDLRPLALDEGIGPERCRIADRIHFGQDGLAVDVQLRAGDFKCLVEPER